MGQTKLPLWAAGTHISCSGSYLCQLLSEVCEKNTAKAKEGSCDQKEEIWRSYGQELGNCRYRGVVKLGCQDEILREQVLNYWKQSFYQFCFVQEIDETSPFHRTDKTEIWQHSFFLCVKTTNCTCFSIRNGNLFFVCTSS